MSSVFQNWPPDEIHRSFTQCGSKQIQGHEEAVHHFDEGFSNDYKNYEPMDGYKVYAYHHKGGKGGSVAPNFSETISLKGKFVKAVAKHKVEFKWYRKRRKSRCDYIVNVLFHVKGDDPDTRCPKRFLWD